MDMTSRLDEHRKIAKDRGSGGGVNTNKMGGQSNSTKLITN